MCVYMYFFTICLSPLKYKLLEAHNRHSGICGMNKKMEFIGTSHISLTSLCLPCQRNVPPYSSLFPCPHLFSHAIALLECSPHFSSVYLNPVFKGQLKFQFSQEAWSDDPNLTWSPNSSNFNLPNSRYSFPLCFPWTQTRALSTLRSWLTQYCFVFFFFFNNWRSQVPELFWPLQ